MCSNSCSWMSVLPYCTKKLQEKSQKLLNFYFCECKLKPIYDIYCKRCRSEDILETEKIKKSTWNSFLYNRRNEKAIVRRIGCKTRPSSRLANSIQTLPLPNNTILFLTQCQGRLYEARNKSIVRQNEKGAVRKAATKRFQLLEHDYVDSDLDLCWRNHLFSSKW